MKKIKYTLLISLLASMAYAAGDWFLEPSVGDMFPLNGGINYHGTSGMVNYKDGYTTGIGMGRYLGNFKIYATYDYTSYQDRGFTLQTPYGKVYQSDNSNYNGQTVMANADFSPKISSFGITSIMGIGMGQTFDGGNNSVFELRAGIEKRLYEWNVSFLYAERFTQGSITEGHVSVEEPRQERIEFKLSKSF